MLQTMTKFLLLPFFLQQSRGNQQKKNVLMLIIDDLRPELQAYGHLNAPRTPSIDKLARSGRVFRRAYSQFADCAPSRTSFLTGLRPDTTGINSHSCSLPNAPNWCHFRHNLPKTITMPEFFRDAGYISLSYGKVFHQGLDDDLSWSSQEEFNDGYARGSSNDNWEKREWVYEEWFDPANKNCSPRNHAFGSCFTEEHYSNAPNDKYIDHRTASAAIESLKRLHEKSFFMAVGFVRPHLPFVCPGKYWNASYPGSSRTQTVGSPSAALKSMVSSPKSGFNELAAFLPEGMRDSRGFRGDDTKGCDQDILSCGAIRRSTVHGYRSCVSFIDEQVGRVLGALTEFGHSDKTVVVLISDHGWKLGEFNMWGKHSIMHADAHVPLIIRCPGMISAGVPSFQIVELIDIFPTVVELAIGDVAQFLRVDGISIKDLVINHPSKVDGAKSLAVTQYAVKGSEYECMAYLVSGPIFTLKRWFQRKDAPECPEAFLNSVDIYRVADSQMYSSPIGGSRHDAVSFNLESSNNLARSLLLDLWAEGSAAPTGRALGGITALRQFEAACKEKLSKLMPVNAQSS